MADSEPADQALAAQTSSMSPASAADDPVLAIDRGGLEESAQRRQLADQLRRRAIRVRGCGNSVPSPCLSVCRVNDNSGFCEGCFRTMSEISSWGRSGPVWQKQLWQTILERLDHASS